MVDIALLLGAGVTAAIPLLAQGPVALYSMGTVPFGRP